jgi:hypothetical protein
MFGLSLVLLQSACTTSRPSALRQTTSNAESMLHAEAPAIVYKTRGDYRNLVAVQLSDDRSTIVSYPAPGDVRKQGAQVLPTELKNGYWLDNRGIGVNVAFLNISYDEYAKLSKAPSLQEMYDRIQDKDPLTALCNCGRRDEFVDIVAELNALIAADKLKERCTTIK